MGKIRKSLSTQLIKQRTMGLGPIYNKRKPGRKLMHLPREQVKFFDRVIRYPILGSPKLNGIRAILHDGQLLSINLKPFKNKQLQTYFKPIIDEVKDKGYMLDGDLHIMGHTTLKEISSLIHSEDKEINPLMVPTFIIFDGMKDKDWEKGTEPLFNERIGNIIEDFKELLEERGELICLQDYITINNYKEAEALFNEYTEKYNYEGLLMHHPKGLYKRGRATTKEGIGFKFKKWKTFKGEVKELLNSSTALVHDEKDEDVKVVFGNNKVNVGDFIEYKVDSYNNALHCIYTEHVNKEDMIDNE